MGPGERFDRNERAIVRITMLGHGIVHIFELSIPVFIPLWIDEFGISPAVIGAVVALGYALYGFGALPGGILADRFGCSRVLRYCLAGMAGSFILLSIAPSLAVVTLALVLWGVAASVYHPAGLSLISTAVRHRGKALGYHGIAGNVGIALGPLVTIVALLVLPWRTVAALLALPAVLGVAIVLLIDVEERPSGTGVDADGTEITGETVTARATATTKRKSLRAFRTNTRALFTVGFSLVFVLYVLEGLYYRGTLTFLPDLLGDFDAFRPVSVGSASLDPTEYIYAALLLVGVVGQYAGGILTDRIRPERGILAVFTGLAIVALVFIPAADAGIVPLLLVSAALGLLLFGIQPIMQASVADHTPAKARGSSFGFVFAATFGIGSAGAAITGVVLTYAGPAELFAVLAGFAVVAVLTTWRLVTAAHGP